MASLTLRDLNKTFGSVEVLRGINLEVDAGEFVVLVGPSGCGKSTLLAMIAGLESVTSGQISIAGRPVNDVPPKDRDIAMVFQSYALYPTMTVRGNITFGMESRGVPKKEQAAALARVAALLQIEKLLNRKPGQLSGGQRQRVAMGRALVRDPALFLFDEPLSNLDAKLRVEMRTEIKKLHQRLAKTTVYVTHDQVEAMTLASRIAVMHQGRVQQFAVPRMVYDRPANMFVAGFMGSPSMNFVPAEVVAAGARPAIAIAGANGPAVVLPLPEPTPNSLGDRGRRVVLGVRPEHLTRYDRRLREDKPHLATLEAPVEVVEPTGAETMAVVRLGEREVIARFEADAAPVVGERVTLALDMARACLFDAETEALI
ncbi:MAG: sn-glycerol-3-phosphate ABC transporter ATP-binding protein UgpC [Methylobacteriaceae bacterium]|nr:sn-glycerol-3-phosphate ABC transporter ATP-binding protein UgpC [Methylobacteriaceae bacterium]